MQHPEEAEDNVDVWIYYSGKEKVPPTVRRVKIAENIRKIAFRAFQEHQQLEEVILSSSVQVIGREAFSGCWKLKSILYQGLEKEEVGIPSNVKVIDGRAFFGCPSLEELVLNEGLVRIGKRAFRGCNSLTEVDFPSTIIVIDDYAFHYCTGLV